MKDIEATGFIPVPAHETEVGRLLCVEHLLKQLLQDL